MEVKYGKNREKIGKNKGNMEKNREIWK